MSKYLSNQTISRVEGCLNSAFSKINPRSLAIRIRDLAKAQVNHDNGLFKQVDLKKVRIGVGFPGGLAIRIRWSTTIMDSKKVRKLASLAGPVVAPKQRQSDRHGITARLLMVHLRYLYPR